MKKFYILFLFLLFSFWEAEAQSTLAFKVKQAPPLMVNAGNDTTIKRGEKTRLTGTVSGGDTNYTYAWTPSEGLDRADIPNPIAAPLATTTYTLSVSDAAGCTRTASVTVAVNSVTGINKESDEFGLSVYPNPNNGTFNVSSVRELDQGPVLLEIYDPLGKLMHREVVEPAGKKLETSISLYPESKGLFILRLTGSKLNLTKKIIVQ